jgi:hypothetical protein
VASAVRERSGDLEVAYLRGERRRSSHLTLPAHS